MLWMPAQNPCVILPILANTTGSKQALRCRVQRLYHPLPLIFFSKAIIRPSSTSRATLPGSEFSLLAFPASKTSCAQILMMPTRRLKRM